MSFFEYSQQFIRHFSPVTVQLIISVSVIILYFIISRRVMPLLYQVIAHSRLKAEMNKRAAVVLHILLVLALIVVLSVVWGVDIRGLLVLASSMIAVVGVALFAAWSLLSNITAFFILLGQKAFAEGMEVRVIDGGNYLEGRIVEINLFSTVLRTKDNEQVVYPNNLLISRPVVVFPRKSRKIVQNTVAEKAQRWRRKVLIGQKCE
ncbi:MAG: mechanosensitive ion channel protein MscS [Alteromonadaceae bacterium]|uniref:mechanosensitive ion channel domain-containing protein n=1 Tax=Rheinheimera aquimaris TaxID=412437 RepID=UPI000C3E10C4|nr:mechanosensitive ion channel domain-containing protein [Rheinheimera aquimaris]MBJ91108.1 mechanosensitive ion channel protein MscS [Alteromonadaceae bacterium]HBN90529.1 mechanosensitive ion channel protein MscS [Rheinheimera sp.]